MRVNNKKNKNAIFFYNLFMDFILTFQLSYNTYSIITCSGTQLIQKNFLKHIFDVH